VFIYDMNQEINLNTEVFAKNYNTGRDKVV
jgi:hypothetical protein